MAIFDQDGYEALEGFLDASDEFFTSGRDHFWGIVTGIVILVGVFWLAIANTPWVGV